MMITLTHQSLVRIHMHGHTRTHTRARWWQVDNLLRLNNMFNESQFRDAHRVIVPKDKSMACSRGCVAITGKAHLACDCTAHKIQKWGANMQSGRSPYGIERELNNMERSPRLD